MKKVLFTVIILLTALTSIVLAKENKKKKKKKEETATIAKSLKSIKDVLTLVNDSLKQNSVEIYLKEADVTLSTDNDASGSVQVTLFSLLKLTGGAELEKKKAITYSFIYDTSIHISNNINNISSVLINSQKSHRFSKLIFQAAKAFSNCKDSIQSLTLGDLKFDLTFTLTYADVTGELDIEVFDIKGENKRQTIHEIVLTFSPIPPSFLPINNKKLVKQPTISEFDEKIENQVGNRKKIGVNESFENEEFVLPLRVIDKTKSSWGSF
jgi:hypothetical protein